MRLFVSVLLSRFFVGIRINFASKLFPVHRERDECRSYFAGALYRLKACFPGLRAIAFGALP